MQLRTKLEEKIHWGMKMELSQCSGLYSSVQMKRRAVCFQWQKQDSMLNNFFNHYEHT